MSKERIGIILDVDAEISKAKGNISSLTKLFDGVGGSKGNQLRDLLSDISAEYDKLADQSGKTMSKVGDFTKAEKSSERLNQLFRKLEKGLGDISKASGKDASKFFPSDVADKVQKASDAIKTYNTILDNSGKKKGAIGQATKEFNEQEKAVRKAAQALQDLENIKAGTSKKQVVTAGIKVDKQNELRNAKTELQNYTDELQEAQQAMADLEKRKPHLWANKSWNRSQEFKDLNIELQTAQKHFDAASDKVNNLNRELKNMVVVGDLDDDIKNAKEALDNAQKAAIQLRQNLDNVTATEFTRALDEAKKKLEGLSGIDLSEIKSLDDLNDIFDRFTKEGISGLEDALQKAGLEVRELGNANADAEGKIRNTTAELERQNRAMADVDAIKKRVLEFFSLTNGITIARRVISQATEAIKELDAAMTETAVVTDFSVGDMWEALPRYTETANELGATTLGAYETMTLFYQQGLSTNEVFEIGTETMKMARIAGLEYADATNLMTAALRGFNMELNETSAQKINDVYSELAAITAADTNEIATAMTKTASIADSANMEFETTAALLSQIIETTREPAETAGTAMKTIIARFTEMKKATSDLINVDGEEVSVNKVETALKSAGVALRDVNGEFRDLDDVFLELSSKWDSLDIMTQRYVATMAAGSRQQSRFIAMMSNYDRTMELVDAAYDSAGASAQQFAKTQDSFEAKINGLTNAWNEYLLSLANSDVVKGFISALTELLNIINDLTAGGGAFSGSLLKIFTAVAGFKGLRAIFSSAFSSLGGIFTKEGIKAGNDFGSGVKNGLKNLKVNFPFIGTLRKELKNVKKDISDLESRGEKVTIGGISSLKKSPNVTQQFSGDLGQSVSNYIQQELKKIGTLTDEGQEWAQQLINGFVSELNNGTEIDAALQNLNNKINNGVVVTTQVDTGEKDADGNPIMEDQTGVNKKYINPNNPSAPIPQNIDASKATIDPKIFDNAIKKTNEYSMALTSVGMVVSALGSKMSDAGGTLGKFGMAIEVVGNSASTAGMALSAFSSLAQIFPKLLTAAGGHIGIIIAAVAAAISLITGLIQKHKELEQAAQQQVLDTAKETREEVEANRELVDSLDETVEAYREGAATREDVAGAADELIDKYGLENDKVLLLTGNYEALTKAIREKQRAQEEENLDAQQGATATSRARLVSGGLSDFQNLSYGMFSSDEVNAKNEDFVEKFDALAIEKGFEDVISVGEGGVLSFTKDITSFTDEELARFSTFITRYLSLLEETLRDQGLNPEDSEVYLELVGLISDTSTDFEELSVSVDSAHSSLQKLAAYDFENEFNINDLNTYSEFSTGFERYIELLQKKDDSLTYEQARELAQDYFTSNTKTKAFAQADKIIMKLEGKFDTNSLKGLDIYQKYINGEISAEEFVSLLISIDIETTTDTSDLNQQVVKNRVKSAIEAPTTFQAASASVSNYMNENFSIDGMNLDDFEATLLSIQAVLPEEIDLLEQWKVAMQGGTLGIAQFISQTQSLLDMQSALLVESGLNQSIYGIAGTDADIEAITEQWNAATTDDQKKQIASSYGMSVDTLSSGLTLYGQDYETQEAALKGNIAAAQTEYQQYLSSSTRRTQVTQLAGINSDIATQQKIIDDAKAQMPEKPQEIELYSTDEYGVMHAAEGVKQIEGKWGSVQFQHEATGEVFSPIEATDANKDGVFTVPHPDLETWEELQTKIEDAKAKIKSLQEEKIDIEANIEADETKFEEAITKAEGELENLQQKAAIKQQLEIEVAMRDAEQLTVLQTQFAKLKQMAGEDFKVDLSSFEQMRQIAPEIANDVKILADGTLDVSAGMEALNATIAEQVKLKGANAEATLQEGVAAENALQVKLQAAIDAINAELAATEASGDEKANLEEQTQEALAGLTADGCLERALLFEEEAQDQADAAQQGALGVINSIEGMDQAYANLSITIAGIHEQMLNLGKAGYNKGALKKQAYDAARALTNTDPIVVTDESKYTSDDVEGWITDPDKISTKDNAERKAQLEATRAYLEELKTNSINREGDYTAAIAGLRGGGNDYGTESDSGGGSKGSGSKDKDEKVNYTNPTLENINEKLENLERKRKNGEIDALEYETQKKGLLGLKQGALLEDFNKALKNSKYKEYFGYDEETDSILLNEIEFNKLSNDKKDAVMEEYERIKGINDQLNEIEDEIGEYAANANTVDAINAALEAIERKHENKDISTIEYTKERDALLSKKAIILQATLDDELKNNVESRFFYYDEVLDAVLINEEEFNKLSEDRQEEVRKEYEKIKSINDELNEIEDTLKDMEFRTPEDRQQYQLGEAMNWNAQGDLDSINRKRDELSRYDELIGKLPSEMQGPLTLMTGGMNMLYEAEESQVLRRQEEALRMELEAKERNAQFLDNGINDPNEAIYYYDPTTQSYKIHEDRFAGLKTQEERDAVMDEIEKMKGYADAINEVQTQRSGGIFQKPFYLAEKSAKAMQKAFKNTGNTAKDVKDAFNDLEKALGLSETALDKFEGGLTEAIEQSGLKDKEIKGLGLLSDEQFNKLNNSKLGGFMGDNTKAFAQMLLGEGSTNGMDFANTGLGALSEMFGFTGDLMNFDMMGMGLDMLNTGKGMIEQGMQMVEKIIGYITQAVQVVVDAWTNREDYLYNFLQIIEKHLRDYEKLQREQNQIEKGRYASVDDIKENWDAQWKSLQTQLEEQTERLETRQKELERSRWNPFSLISGWDPSTDTLYENRTVKFAWDLFIGFGSMAPMGLGSLFGSLNQLYEDYDKRVQNSYEDRLAAEQAILDIEDQRLELVKAGSEQATEFEQRVMDAMVQKEQEQIEELTRLNDTISEANSKLIETLRSNLEKMRQERENEKTEEELGEKERRLAYLRQDTSGANMMEIKKLEEQLEEGHESYTDKLIDQKISELEDQNDKAAEQRQKQIDLLQGQLDYAEKYGLYWDKIYGMLYTFDENGNAVLNPDNFDLDGNIRKNSELDKLLGTFSDRIGMSAWSTVLDAEELDYLGKYYGAFIEYNGVTGDWKNAWALRNPGGADPRYAFPEEEQLNGIWGVLQKLEVNLKKNSIHNNPDIINRGGRLEESFKNFFGKLFGNDEWANYQYVPTNAAHVTASTTMGMKEDWDNITAWLTGNNSSARSRIASNAKTISLNSGGTQNYGDTNVNNHFNIGSVGESVSLDDLTNRMTNIFKDMFSTGNNVLRNGH